MIVTTKLARKFLFKQDQQEIKLSDPSPSLSPQQVMNFFAGTYSMLTIATVEGPEIVDDEIQYRFKTTLGTKG